MILMEYRGFLNKTFLLYEIFGKIDGKVVIKIQPLQRRKTMNEL